MERQYELTDAEYVTILQALQHARDDAVFSDSKARCSNVIYELNNQNENQDGQKMTAKEGGLE